MSGMLARRGQFVMAPLHRRDVEAAHQLCLRDEVAHVVPLMHVETARAGGAVPHGLWGVHRRLSRDRELVALIWAGANLNPVLPEGGDEGEADALRAEVAQALVARVARPAAMAGPAQVTLDLWGRVEPWWGPARELRPRQVSMVCDGEPTQVRPATVDVEPLRRATEEDYAQVLAAAVHMFRGEVGYDPLRYGRAAYEQRLHHLIRTGRTLVQMGMVQGRREVVFKADVGVVGGRVAQVQGVWVNPALRGRGLAAPGMAQAVRMIRANIAPRVSLYVNDFNEPALRAYRSVGFCESGMFATVMF